MIAITGDDVVPCAPYATFGTQELADHVVRALEGRKACLLANHGMIAAGANLAEAFKIAREVETIAEQYWRALQIGRPVVLDGEEMARVRERFKTYGQQLKPSR
jgi:L-fuculose-phosphate aldolase